MDEKSWPPPTGLEPLFAGRNLRKYARALDQSATRRPFCLVIFLLCNHFHYTVYQVSFEIVRHSRASWRKKSECSIFKVNFINIRVGKCATRKPKLGFLWNFWCHSAIFHSTPRSAQFTSLFPYLRDVTKKRDFN